MNIPKFFFFPIIGTLLSISILIFLKQNEPKMYYILYNVFVVSSLEIILSFDNAVLNTRILQKMSVFWRKAFLFIGIFMIDFFFYIGHYIMHNKYLYKWSHKKHHEFDYPVGLEALYLHWFDLIFGNIIPLYLPILILNNHIYTLLLWTIFTISSTVLVAHSSFNDKFYLNHHIYRTLNYGHGTYMDRIFKTEII